TNSKWFLLRNPTTTRPCNRRVDRMSRCTQTSVSLIGGTRSEGRRSRAWRRRQRPRRPRERSRQLRRVGGGGEGRGGGAASIASMPPRRRGPCASTHALSRWSSPPFSSLTTLV
ncbi:unnamed protein product, partial [Musa acuminata subsp. burmannicoides]